MKNCNIEGPHYRLPHRLLKTKLYNKWMGTADCRVYTYLVPNVIRSCMKSKRLNKLYENYYLKKGLLVATAKQTDIANFLDKADSSPISKCLTHMLEQGLIKLHMDSFNGNSMKVYELGYLSDPPERNELWHMHLYMYQNKANLDLQKKFT